MTGIAAAVGSQQLMQAIGLLIAGLLAWGNLKGDLREGFATTTGRLNSVEARLARLEAASDRNGSDDGNSRPRTMRRVH